jgi:hypothetical protein
LAFQPSLLGHSVSFFHPPRIDPRLPRPAAFLASDQASAFDVECGGGCGASFDSQVGMTTASASYSNPNGGSASAFATIGSGVNGSLSLKAFATGSAGDLNSNRGSAIADWEDVIHTSGTLLDILIDLEFKLTGSTSGDGRVSASVGYCIDDYCPMPTSVEGPATFHITAGELISPSEHVTLSINLHATASGTALVEPASSAADFSHSMELVSITPTDADGHIVPGITITSDSGFDYNPLLVTNQTPEPRALALGTVALVALAGLSRAKRRT